MALVNATGPLNLEETQQQVASTLTSRAADGTVQEVRDLLSLPLNVVPRVGGAPVTGTNPLPISGVFADANGVPYTDANPLPVTMDNLAIDTLNVSYPPSIVSDENSRTAPLAADEEFVGTWVDALQYAAVQVAILTDQASAANGAKVEFSDDTTHVVRTLTATIPANTGLAFTISPEARYLRLRLQNGPIAQSLLRAQTILMYNAPASGALPLGATSTDLMAADVGMAHLKGRHSTGAWLPISTDGLGNLSIRGTVSLTAGTEVNLTATSLAALEEITAVVSGTLAVSGTVSVDNFPATTEVSNFPATQTVAGTVEVSNFPATVEIANTEGDPIAVSGPLTDVQLRSSAVPVSGTVDVANFPATQAITATDPIPVTGAFLTDAELRASGLDVADDYAALEVLADQTGTGAVLTFTFSAAVNLAVVHAVGSDQVARATTTSQTPSATLGVRCPDDVPTFMPVTTSALRVFAPNGMAVTVYGYRR